jgi:hypothetical protein
MGPVSLTMTKKPAGTGQKNFRHAKTHALKGNGLPA